MNFGSKLIVGTSHLLLVDQKGTDNILELELVSEIEDHVIKLNTVWWGFMLTPIRKCQSSVKL